MNYASENKQSFYELIFFYAKINDMNFLVNFLTVHKAQIILNIYNPNNANTVPVPHVFNNP
jgi:hypothetical protein